MAFTVRSKRLLLEFLCFGSSDNHDTPAVPEPRSTILGSSTALEPSTAPNQPTAPEPRAAAGTHAVEPAIRPAVIQRCALNWLYVVATC